MATVSATQQIRTITPPSSSHGGVGNGSWKMENENPVYNDEKAYLAYDNRAPIAQQLGNGNRKMSYSSDDYLAPRKSNTLGRKKSDMGLETEADYNLDAYKAGAASKSLPNGIDKGGKRKPSKAMLRTAEEDENNWIHRDKLAQIESRELEEAGFPVGHSSRSGSRATNYSRQEQNKDHDTEDEYTLKHDTKRQKMVSPIPAEEEEDEPQISFEFRTPEEVAMEQDARQYFHTPSPANPKGTRLPMPKASPVPVPSVIMERDSPLPRSRTGSGNAIPEPRPRSRSIHSQVILDDDTPRTPVHARRPSASASSDGSPPKSRISSKTPTSGIRKSGTLRKASEPKPRNSSQQNRASPEKRPGTSSGRPSTSHRPEGDPPWIASMYKPDPRLPPDQQMLPTHAKRLAQERWEKEGKTGTMYDREFRLLNSEEIPVPEKLPESEHRQQGSKNADNEEWRMSISTGTGWPLGSGESRPGTSGTEHGGYSTMPKIASPQMVPLTPVGAGNNATAGGGGVKEREKEMERTSLTAPSVHVPSVHVPIRVKEPVEDEKEKKGCCCVVM